MRTGLILWVSIALGAVLFVLNLEVSAQGGSRAVLSQAVYNVADLVGSVMLVWGFFAARRVPDVNHPFGYGKERFFWAFAASLVTFSLAGTGVLFLGVDQILSPRPVTDLTNAVLVVGVTLLASLVSLAVILRELRETQSSVSSFLESAQQSMKTIFYQDLVSAAGSALAFGGIVAVYFTGRPEVDGATAVGVGVVMLLTGVVLAAEARELLVGKALSLKQASQVVARVERDPRVRSVRGLQSMLLGPEDALLALRLNFQDGLTTDEIERTIDEIAAAIRADLPFIRHLVIEPES
jgi:cation diffusion facilitator family transporter